MTSILWTCILWIFDFMKKILIPKLGTSHVKLWTNSQLLFDSENGSLTIIFSISLFFIWYSRRAELKTFFVRLSTVPITYDRSLPDLPLDECGTDGDSKKFGASTVLIKNYDNTVRYEKLYKKYPSTVYKYTGTEENRVIYSTYT